MTGPMVILALGALGVGACLYWTHDFSGRQGFLAQTPSLAYLGTPANEGAEGEFSVAVTGTLAALGGVVLAMVLYLGRPGRVEALTRVMSAVGLYGLSRGKFFFDPIYRLLVVLPLEGFARFCAWTDRYVIDGLVNSVGRLPLALGASLRPLQGGLVQFYALAMVLGLLALIVALLM
jgi:NADH-quinone oxidoreductase subunit L